jgi:hypothetical protein
MEFDYGDTVFTRDGYQGRVIGFMGRGNKSALLRLSDDPETGEKRMIVVRPPRVVRVVKAED